jgi:hypothetical protein
MFGTERLFAARGGTGSTTLVTDDYKRHAGRVEAFERALNGCETPVSGLRVPLDMPPGGYAPPESTARGHRRVAYSQW